MNVFSMADHQAMAAAREMGQNMMNHLCRLDPRSVVEVGSTLVMFKNHPMGAVASPVPIPKVSREEKFSGVKMIVEDLKPDSYAIMELVTVTKAKTDADKAMLMSLKMHGAGVEDMPNTERRLYVIFQAKSGHKMWWWKMGDTNRSEVDDLKFLMLDGPSISSWFSMGGLGL